MPKSEAVEARRNAVMELIASRSDQPPKALLALAQGIAAGFGGAPSEAVTIEWLLRTLKKHDPAVSESLSENEMELRCIAGITFGELMLQSKEDPDDLATAVAAAFISALNMRQLPKQRYLGAMIEELSGLAIAVLETAADARRKRSDLKILQDSELEVPDPATAQEVISHLQNQIRDLEVNAIIDREEISLFWFITAGFSQNRKKAFSSLSASVAAVHAALDIHRAVLIPVPLNCFEILDAIVERKRDAETLKPIPLAEHPKNWSLEEWDSIAGADSLAANLASEFPAIFPVIWIAKRMREGKSLPNWAEFRRATRLQEKDKLSATNLGRQLLNEKNAVSLMEGLLE